MSTRLPRRIVVCGEALIDLVPASLPGTWNAVCGGGPANAAVALAKLGTATTLLCRLSRDGFGRRLRAHLTAANVDLSLAVDAVEPTTLAVVDVDDHGCPAYTFHLAATADWQWSPTELPDRLPPDTAALHVGSLAAVIPPGAQILRTWVAKQRKGFPVLYDINVRPAVLPDRDAYRAQVAAWLDIADIVKASEEDLRWLYPADDPEQVAKRWAAGKAARTVLLTRGAEGATVLGPDGTRTVVPGHAVPVVDTVGAGDTFTAAYLHWIGVHGPHQAAQALAYATAAAAITCTRPGAQPPTAKEVEAFLGSVGPIVPRGPLVHRRRGES